MNVVRGLLASNGMTKFGTSRRAAICGGIDHSVRITANGVNVSSVISKSRILDAPTLAPRLRA
jgi:hypothetical protein